jgi:hypothetical protein
MAKKDQEPMQHTPKGLEILARPAVGQTLSLEGIVPCLDTEHLFAYHANRCSGSS